MNTYLLPHPVALELTHPYVAQLADMAGTDVLFFKGVSAQVQQIRATKRTSADVDVLVRPSQFAQLLALAYQFGWKARFFSEEVPKLLPGHSVTLVHPSWPNDIDVHAFLPGVIPSPEDVFELLWLRKSSVTIAGHDVNVPCRADHITMLGINAMREPQASTSKTEIAYLAELLRTNQELAEKWVESRDKLRTRTQLSTLSTLAGINPGTPDLSPDELRTWNLFRDSENGTGALRYVQRMVHLRSLREVGQTFIRIFWKPLPELRIANPDIQHWTLPTVLHFQWHRIIRGAKGLPEIAKSLRRHELLLTRGPAITRPTLYVAPENFATPNIFHHQVSDQRQSSDFPEAASAPSPISASVSGHTSESALAPSPDSTMSALQQPADATTNDQIVVRHHVAGQASINTDTIAVLEHIDVHLHKGPYAYEFSGTSKAIWTAIDGQRSIGEICERLSHDYNTPAGVVRDDVHNFVQSLLDRGLLKRQRE